ncbi:hypothetical protein [Chitinophaga sedimenti]|uniref:hypothetical protein n=1 Tax=Chitinophaga sedimenti TaxID=2033606 RepID=UPI0035568CFA
MGKAPLSAAGALPEQIVCAADIVLLLIAGLIVTVTTLLIASAQASDRTMRRK